MNSDAIKANEAIWAAYTHSPSEWRLMAEEAVKEVALNIYTFTTANVWYQLEEWGYQKPPEPRALGGVMRRLKRDGVIEPTGQYRNCGIRHGSPLTVWRGVQ
tara:strand:- start:8907 stop:9212 length:306 start_codon:yes stop_codon:yes gene_type:complete